MKQIHIGIGQLKSNNRMSKILVTIKIIESESSAIANKIRYIFMYYVLLMSMLMFSVYSASSVHLTIAGRGIPHL